MRVIRSLRRRLHHLRPAGKGRAGGPGLSSRAEVATDASRRYAKQLASHLGRHVSVTPEDGGDRLGFESGSCLVSTGPVSIILVATAPDAASLTTVKDVVGRHLERFGQRNELVVTWVDG